MLRVRTPLMPAVFDEAALDARVVGFDFVEGVEVGHCFTILVCLAFLPASWYLSRQSVSTSIVWSRARWEASCVEQAESTNPPDVKCM